MGLTVYTTTPDEKTAEALAEEIVVAKLGACCNFWPIKTIYSWEGELKKDTEHIILIKTSKTKYEELEKYIVKNHPYSMPAVVSLPWDDAYKPFKDWVNNDE